MILKTPGTRLQNGILTEAYYGAANSLVLQNAFDTFQKDELSSPADARHYVLRNAMYGYIGDIINHDEFKSWATQRLAFHHDKKGSRPVIDTHLHRNLRTPSDRIVTTTVLAGPELPPVIEACRFVLGGTTKNFWINATNRYATNFSKHRRFGEQKARLALDRWRKYQYTLESLGVLATAQNNVPKTKHARVVQFPPAAR